jgi:hypothetical protein
MNASIWITDHLNNNGENSCNSIRRPESDFTFPSMWSACWRRRIKQHSRKLVAHGLHERARCNVIVANDGIGDANQCARGVVCKLKFTDSIKDKNCIARDVE